MTDRPIRLGTRGSQLALTQSGWVADQLRGLGHTVDLHIIRTTGDRFAEKPVDQFTGKGVFVAELEHALLRGEIDLAVHSMKDIPGEMAEGLTIACVPVREDPRDVLVGRTAPTLATLPQGARLGTSSLRRRVQLHLVRPDLELVDMRGNVDTRLRKLDEGQYDAICLAAAGLHRLGLGARISEYFAPEIVLSAAGQGALALQTRTDDAEVISALAPLHDEATGLASRSERAVLAALGGGCSVPFGTLATVKDGCVVLTAVLCSTTSNAVVREELSSSGSPEELGREMAALLLARGAEM